MTKRYTVYFPTVPLAAAGTPEIEGQLFGVYAQPYGFGEDPTDLISTPNQESGNPPRRKEQDEDQKAIQKYWDRVTAPLRKAGFVKIGPGVAGKVRLLILKRPWLALYQRFWKPHAYIDHLRLHTATPVAVQAWVAADSVEGRSSELALALALLLAACRAPHRLVIATGQLGEETGSPRDPDIKVSSVGKIPDKLRLIHALASANQLPPQPGPRDPVWLFTPTTFNDHGEPVPVETLPEVAHLRELGITVIPVPTLREAARRLQAERVRWMWQDGAWLGGIAGMMGLALMLNTMIERLTPPPPPPKLTVRVQNQELKDVPYVGLHQALKLEFTQNPGEFHYVLTLDSDGDAHFLHQFDPKKSEDTITIPAVKTESRGVFILLMLVADRMWSRNQGEKLAEQVARLGLRPELPEGVRYRFDSEHCGPVDVPVPDGLTFKGGPAQCTTCDQPPLPAACDDWVLQLLNTLRQYAPGKIRLDGIAFQVSRD